MRRTLDKHSKVDGDCRAGGACLPVHRDASGGGVSSLSFMLPQASSSARYASDGARADIRDFILKTSPTVRACSPR